jgi:hypothetical protein
MTANFEISDEERERICRGHVEDFPKYTTQILNLANQNAQSTRPRVVGDMNDLIEEFEEKHPNGTFEDWKEFYLKEKEGERKLDESSDKLLEMVKRIKDAMEKIEENMAERYIRDLVLYKTYTQIDHPEVIIKRTANQFQLDYEIGGDTYIDGKIGDVPVRVVSMQEASGISTADNVARIVYKENKSNNGLEVDATDLENHLNRAVVDGEVNKKLDL